MKKVILDDQLSRHKYAIIQKIMRFYRRDDRGIASRFCQLCL